MAQGHTCADGGVGLRCNPDYIFCVIAYVTTQQHTHIVNLDAAAKALICRCRLELILFQPGTLTQHFALACRCSPYAGGNMKYVVEIFWWTIQGSNL